MQWKNYAVVDSWTTISSVASNENKLLWGNKFEVQKTSCVTFMWEKEDNQTIQHELYSCKQNISIGPFNSMGYVCRMLKVYNTMYSARQ
jgi:hypothetical protein